MKHSVYSSTIVFGVILLFWPLSPLMAQTETEDAPKIAVWDFSLQGMQPNEGRAVTNRLRSVLVNSRQFRVMTRDQIETLLGEQALGQTLIDAREAIKAGKLKGVRYVITGSLLSVRGAFQITAEMIDGQTAEILESYTPKTYRGDFLDFLDNEVPRVANRLLAATNGSPVIAEKAPDSTPQPKMVTPPPAIPTPPRQPVYSQPTGSPLGPLGGIAITLGIVAEVVAIAVFSEATLAAEEANTDNDAEAYQSALDKRAEAESLEGLAIGLGAIGIVLLIVDSAISTASTDKGKGSGEMIAAPIDLRPLPKGGMQATYTLRW